MPLPQAPGTNLLYVRRVGLVLLVALALAAFGVPAGISPEQPPPLPVAGEQGDSEPAGECFPCPVIVPEPEHRRIAYLTFDDGPSLNTPAVLDVLARYGVRATFFVCGNLTDFGRDIYRRMLAEGHTIGNHSFSHNPARIYASADAFFEDFFRLQDLVYEATGFRPEVVRFPGGSNNNQADRELMLELISRIRELGLEYCDWNVCSGDALQLYQDPEVIIRNVIEGVQGKDRAIVLFHDSRTRMGTVQALPAILEALIDMGFQFQTLGRESFTVQFLR